MTYYIVAGNYREAKECIREQNLDRSDTVIVKTALSLEGQHITKDDKVIYYGTWETRNGLAFIERAIDNAKIRGESTKIRRLEDGESAVVRRPSPEDVRKDSEGSDKLSQ